MFEKIIENRYKKRYDAQRKINERQKERIILLEEQVKKLENECKEKDELINCVEPMRKEMKQQVDKAKEYKEECKKLLAEIRKMKTIMDKEEFHGKWWFVRFLIK